MYHDKYFDVYTYKPFHKPLVTQLSFTYSKSTIVTLEKGVKYAES